MRKLVILTIAIALITAMSGGVINAVNRTVEITGGENFQPNTIFQSNFAFHPGAITVDNGDTLTLDDKDQFQGTELPDDIPHTITIVEEDDLPATFLEVLLCRELSDRPCNVRGAGFHDGANCPNPVVDPDEDGGLNVPGDSVCLAPGDDSRSGTITAPSGTTLFYICAFHPWMQGSIKVNNG
jgi:plastocyanin